jgi:hypothetical protein
VGKRLLYVVGFPGCGKTAAMTAILGSPCEIKMQPFKHMVYRNGVIQLGGDREYHGGTDALALNVQPKVIDWMARIGPSQNLIVGEGDRLANSRFFDAVVDQGWKLRLVWIDVPALTARNRAYKRGSRFNDSWYKGRVTKVRNLVSQRHAEVVRVDGTNGPEVVATHCRWAMTQFGAEV